MKSSLIKTLAIALMAAGSACAFSAHADSFTSTSPAGGQLPSGATPVGGVVLDLIGLNGVRIVSEAPASLLYVGYAPSDPSSPSGSENPFSFGSQGGFTSTLLSDLGGGLSQAAVRITLYDGDSSPPDFDYNMNELFVGGADFGNWSSVLTEITSADGTSNSGTVYGFSNDELNTGFFDLKDPTQLALLYTALGSGSVSFDINDQSPGDNYFDFTQGVDGSLINVGSGPVITPISGAPEPGSWALMLGGVGVLGAMMRVAARRRRDDETCLAIA